MENIPTLLEDDPLRPLLFLSTALTKHWIIQKISYFYYAFFVVTACGNISVVIFTNQWSLVFTRYSALAGGVFIGYTSYVTLYHTTYVLLFWNIQEEIFPSLWALRSMGQEEFTRFQKIAKFTKRLAIFTIFCILVAATSNLPWYGNEYDLLFPVKVAMDYFNTWMLNLFLILFYTTTYHAGLNIAANAFSLTYLVLHLYNQFCMLNRRLRNLTENVGDDCLEYQSFVNEEIVACIKLHQKLLAFADRINELIYFPIYYYTASGVITAITLIIIYETTEIHLYRFVIIAILTVITAAAFCFLGQVLENESEKTFESAYSTPWYLWNSKNRKLLQIFLHKTESKVVLSSSGLITINYQLLIGLYQKIYSSLTFLMNVSNTTNA